MWNPLSKKKSLGVINENKSNDLSFINFIEYFPLPILLVNNLGEATFTNKEFTNTFEYNLSEFDDNSISHFLGSSNINAEINRVMHEINSGREFKFKSTRKSKSGKRIDVLIYAKPIYYGANNQGGYIIYEDISEVNKLKKEIDLIENDLRSRDYDLRRLKSEHTNLRYDYNRMSEEFSLTKENLNKLRDGNNIIELSSTNDLQPIKNQIEEASLEIKKEIKNITDSIQIESIFLTFFNKLKEIFSPDKILEDRPILHGQQIENIDFVTVDGLEIKKQPVTLRKFFFNLYGDIIDKKRIWDKNNVEINLKIPISDPQFSIETDSNILGNCFRSVLNHFIYFSNRSNVDFGYYLDNLKFLKFYILLKGEGIDSVEIERYINEKEIDPKTFAINSNLGIGLLLTKKYINSIGGSLETKYNKIENFTKIEFILPYTPQGNSFIFDNNYNSDILKTFEWSNKKILIVEDLITNYIYLKEILEHTKANFHWSNNGKEAIEYYKLNKDIDIILMDIQMPGLDGFETTKRIKEINPRIPIIAQTAYNNPGDKEKSLKAGCSIFLVKPFSPNELLESINTLIG